MLGGFLLLANVIGELGSVVFIPIAFIMFRFSTKETLALSNTTIFASTVTRLLAESIWIKHPTNATKTVIDYSLTSIMTPIVLVGAYAGALVGIMFPQMALTLVLTVALLAILILTISKGVRLYKNDRIQNELVAQKE